MHTPSRRGLAQSVLLAAVLATGCTARPSPPPRIEPPVDLNVSAPPRGEPSGLGGAGHAFRGDISLAEAVRYSRIEQLLAARAPTLDVIPRHHGRFSLRVRGRPAVTSAGPLVVIDGMQFGDAGAEMLAMIAPRDVRRVEVLKDVSATSAYGARGANGVIVITTRRGAR